jgi:hypothetical protein
MIQAEDAKLSVYHAETFFVVSVESADGFWPIRTELVLTAGNYPEVLVGPVGFDPTTNGL